MGWCDNMTGEKYWVVEYKLWPLYEQSESDLGKHVDKSIYPANGPLDAINAAMYYVRGRKSDYEMASIINLYGPFENEDKAREVQYE